MRGNNQKEEKDRRKKLQASEDYSQISSPKFKSDNIEREEKVKMLQYQQKSPEYKQLLNYYWSQVHEKDQLKKCVNKLKQQKSQIMRQLDYFKAQNKMQKKKQFFYKNQNQRSQIQIVENNINQENTCQKNKIKYLSYQQLSQPQLYHKKLQDKKDQIIRQLKKVIASKDEQINDLRIRIQESSQKQKSKIYKQPQPSKQLQQLIQKAKQQQQYFKGIWLQNQQIKQENLYMKIDLDQRIDHLQLKHNSLQKRYNQLNQNFQYTKKELNQKLLQLRSTHLDSFSSKKK